MGTSNLNGNASEFRPWPSQSFKTSSSKVGRGLSSASDGKSFLNGNASEFRPSQLEWQVSETTQGSDKQSVESDPVNIISSKGGLPNTGYASDGYASAEYASDGYASAGYASDGHLFDGQHVKSQ